MRGCTALQKLKGSKRTPIIAEIGRSAAAMSQSTADFLRLAGKRGKLLQGLGNGGKPIMKSSLWIGAGMSALMLVSTPLLAAPALTTLVSVQSASALSDGMTIEKVASVLRSNGLTVDVSQDGVGDPVIYSEIAGFNFALFGFNCASDGCNEFLFSSYFDTDKKVPLDAINAFNEKTVAGRAFLDGDGDPNLEHLFTVSDGGDSDLIERNLAIWEAVLVDFAEHIEFYDGAAS